MPQNDHRMRHPDGMNRPPGDPEPGSALTTAIAVTGVALVAGATIPILPRRVRPAANVLAAAAALHLALRHGLDRTDLGAAPADLPSGARTGATAAALVTAAAAASVTPSRTRELFVDTRVTEAPSTHAAYEVLVRIPLTTALTEELLFRGAVLGAWRRALGTPAAVAASSLAFGLWHVLPALESHAHNPAGARISARAGGRPAHVVGTVIATAAAGAGFAALRLRSRSVLAPILAHTATNELGYLAARWADGRARQA